MFFIVHFIAFRIFRRIPAVMATTTIMLALKCFTQSLKCFMQFYILHNCVRQRHLFLSSPFSQKDKILLYVAKFSLATFLVNILSLLCVFFF